MSDGTRRKLKEAIYSIRKDPDRKDVFVEGAFDAAILRWFFESYSLHKVAIYSIDTIDIPSEEVIKSGNINNNRGRVIYLSEKIQDITPKPNFVSFIIDADFDYLDSKPSPKCPLFRTDYSSMEIYFYCDACLSKFISLYCMKPWPPEKILKSLSSVLQEILLIRYSNHLLGKAMTLLDNHKTMKLNDDNRIIFDLHEYYRRYLSRNNCADEFDSFVRHVDTLRPKLKSDPRYQVHGHDFMDLLSWFLKNKSLPKSLYNYESIVAGMMATLERDRIVSEKLFGELLERMK